MSNHHQINYIEMPASDIAATKVFFSKVFGWQFTDYGTEYTAFTSSGIDGGFFQAPLSGKSANGAALVVIYSDKLEDTMRCVEAAGGVTTKQPFEFPGGRRFHFTEPSGNELAVWSDR
ncbi:MAG: VOC family protein [Planctomycetes bacterium]|nr:VOC family protein [Planctomycetota bacterium]